MKYKTIVKNFKSADGTWCENLRGCPYRIVHDGCSLYHEFLKEGKDFHCYWFALEGKPESSK